MSVTGETVDLAAQEAEEVAAMEAVFGVETETPEGGEIADVTPAEPETTTEGEGVETPTEPPAEEPPKMYSREELDRMLQAVKTESKAELSKIHDKVFGTIGDLKQRIDAIRATANISPKAKEKLSAEFPELAEMLFDNEPIPTQVPKSETPALPQIDIDQIVNKKLDETQKQFEQRLLKRDHPDWENVVTTNEFAIWKSQIPPEDSATLDSSWDADFISAKLTDFKKWQQQQVEKANKAKAKQDRLEAAVVPQGVPRQPTGGEDDEDEALNSAFNQKMRRY